MFVERKELNKEKIETFFKERGYKGVKVLGLFENHNPYHSGANIPGWEIYFQSLENNCGNPSLLFTDFGVYNYNLQLELDFPNLEKDWKTLLVRTFKGEYVEAYLENREEYANEQESKGAIYGANYIREELEEEIEDFKQEL